MAIFLYGMNIQQITMEQLNSLQTKMSKNRIDRANNYKFVDDKKRCLVGELIVRYALKKHYCLRNEDLEFGSSEYGKPNLKNCEGIYFNISHSGDWVVCAVGDCPVGIDIELIDDRNHDNEQIASTFFTYHENERIQKIKNEVERIVEFYKLWTLKESYLKVLGTGLYKELNSFELRQMNGTELLFEDDKIKYEYIFKNCIFERDYVLSLCTEKTEIKDVQMIGIEEIEHIDSKQE